jgi:hypothetical protein
MSNPPTNKPVSVSRQINAVATAIGQLSGWPKPKPAQLEMLISDLRAVLETLRKLDQK